MVGEEQYNGGTMLCNKLLMIETTNLLPLPPGQSSLANKVHLCN